MTWRIFCLFGQNSTVITPDYFCSCTKYPKKPWWKLTPFINGGQFKILLYWFKLALLTSFQSKNSFNFKMRLERLILILAKEFIIGRHLWKWSIQKINPFTPKSDSRFWLHVHVDFTLSNARRFYPSKGDPLGVKGLTSLLILVLMCVWILNWKYMN